MPVHKDDLLTGETWRMFRIMAEFVDGFDTMSRIGKAVTVFGSARTPESDPYYKQARECGRKLAEKGFAVITGGGPGIMEAANRGAFDAHGTSVGLNIDLPMEQSPNAFQTIELDFRYFFVRKVMFVKYASGFIIFPGGYGTMDEFFESLTLIQTLKIEPFPVICIGKEFWGGLADWLRGTMRDRYKTISPNDLDLFRVTDSVDEAVDFLVECYKGKCWIKQPEPAMTADARETTIEGTRKGQRPRKRRPSDERPNGNRDHPQM